MNLGFSITSAKADYMGSVDFVKLWAEASALLRSVIPDNVYYSWLTAVAANSFEHNKFYLVTPHQFAVAILKSHQKEIKEALCKVCGRDVDFELNYDAEYGKKYNELQKKEAAKQRPSLEDPVKKEQELAEGSMQMRPEVNLNLKYKFENFVVGENSRMAYAVATAVAQKPAQKYNPLFIYGASGLGKTHLMQAIGHHILFNKPKLRVKYVKTEEYINEVISSIQKGGDRVSRMDKFRQKFRNVDVLLIDDIQFIESKERTMEEIFHTFESLHNNGKQIVITSDRLPKDIPTLPDRLRTRFEMGIMVELTPPEFETRIAILRNLAEKDGLNIPCDVYDLMAKSYKNNVRELEGAYNRISAFAEIDGTELSIEYVKKVLNCSETEDALTMQSIAQAVADYYNVTVEDFLSPARSQKISSPRHIVVYAIRELLGASFESIADFLNKKHTTMLYSYEKIRDELKTSRDLQHGIEEIFATLKG
ncbi:MAG: chromosomal replication initiator protein DnaA [Fusobacterium sp.]|nr:chromosomal replication initiator protein DnaA [Fusobacterium sp.]